jgi:hypothetical protein
MRVATATHRFSRVDADVHRRRRLAGWRNLKRK